MKKEVKKVVKGTAKGKVKVTQEVFMEEAKKYSRFFNDGLFEDLARRSVHCKAGRLEIYVQLYKGELSAVIYTHPVETAFESEVVFEKVKSVKAGVELLKKEEAKLKKKKSWWED